MLGRDGGKHNFVKKWVCQQVMVVDVVQPAQMNYGSDLRFKISFVKTSFGAVNNSVLAREDILMVIKPHHWSYSSGVNG